jgi:hypothetical protein
LADDVRFKSHGLAPKSADYFAFSFLGFTLRTHPTLAA